MDENNNLNDVNDVNDVNESGGKPPKENPFKNWRLYAAYLLTIAILAAISWLLTFGDSSESNWTISVLLLCIPYIIAGVIVWAIVRNKNRPIALGILFGSITPFIAVFIVTGGCGLFMF